MRYFLRKLLKTLYDWQAIGNSFENIPGCIISTTFYSVELWNTDNSFVFVKSILHPTQRSVEPSQWRIDLAIYSGMSFSEILRAESKITLTDKGGRWDQERFLENVTLDMILKDKWAGS